MSVTANAVASFAAVQDDITQLADQIKIRLIWQLISGISRVLQKLFRCSNGTFISTFFVSLLPVWPVYFSLKLNRSLVSLLVKSVITPASVKIGWTL